MSSIINFNAQLAPLEHVEKVARREQEHADTSQQALLREAPRLLSKDNEQVRRLPESLGQKVERRLDGRGREAGGGRGEQQERQPAEEKEESGGDFSGSVWTGNILNLKV